MRHAFLLLAAIPAIVIAVLVELFLSLLEFLLASHPCDCSLCGGVAVAPKGPNSAGPVR